MNKSVNKSNEGITAEVIKVIELGIRNLTHSIKSFCKQKDTILLTPNPHKKLSMMV